MKKVLLTVILSLWIINLIYSQGSFKLIWNDEFDGPVLDQTKWDFQLGTGTSEGLTDWGNYEQQYYTKENAILKDGMLVITAKREQKENKLFTSSRLLTRGKFFTTYGRIEARISSVAVEGSWPAFWMLPQNSPYGTWAASGEIDIMEIKGRLPDQYSGAIHYGGIWPGNIYSTTGDYHFPDGTTIENFHVYAIEWKDSEIAWYCDDLLVAKKTVWNSENGPFPAPFDTDFYILLNMAIGGGFDEHRVPPAGFTSGEMKIDYVRVYKWDDNTGIGQLKENVSDITITQSGNEIVINTARDIISVGLYAASGQLFARVEKINKINISGLNSGNYILKVQDEGNTFNTFKIIIQ